MTELSPESFSPESLASRFDFAETQPRIYSEWETRGYFHAEPQIGKEPFTIVIPPPNVTGALHLGHALNNTLQDIQIRMKRMQGYVTLWVPGTDHAGIATQAVVERRLREEEKKTRHDLGREQLVARIWTWKAEYEKRILGQLKQMGCSCDWQRTRFTLDEMCATAVRHTFFDLFQKQLIYRGKKLVNWDTFLQTAVSDDEVFQETVKGNFWQLRYAVIDPQPGEPTHVTVATTRPETMLGDTAVAVHPEPAKALDAAEAELRARLEKAAAKDKEALEEQLKNIAERRAAMLPLLEQLAAMARAGRMLMLPLANRPIPLVGDVWAKPEMGSGCVKITPAHDPNDYDVGRRQKLPMINILSVDGKLNANAGATYQGLTIKQARERVVADLDALGLLGDVEDREIELPHSDRSKTPIEPLLADQWFVRMNELAQSAMDAVTSSQVKIVPQRYAKSYLDWLGEKRDWPVSRQLWWGHQIPIWSRKVATESEAKALLEKFSLEYAEQKATVSIQLEQNPEYAEGNGEIFGTLHICLAKEGDPLEKQFESLGFVREEDVLDTWFSSALWPHSTLGWPEKTSDLAFFYPTSVLITSRDIITLWVARMVLMGLNNMGEVPFREVFIHPKILDGYGETMSKSKGNGVDPNDIVAKFGADALRFGLTCLTTETQDVRMPVQFECPHCEALVDQTKKNRELPRVACTKCGKEFSTQWARKEEDKALPRAAVVSERFEVARNFSNKLWNAARFSLINLKEYSPGSVLPDELAVEDRWLLSRLTTVTREVTEALQSFRYADGAKSIYDFAWDEFCSLYVEITKARLQDPEARPTAQRVLAHTLDTMLRLLHPMMPFLTEEIWQQLAKMAPVRGLREPAPAADWLIKAEWPRADLALQNAEMERRFSIFRAVLDALREIRSRQNISMKSPIEFALKADTEVAELLEPMAPYFRSMANASATNIGPGAEPPATHVGTAIASMQLFVDLKDFIDIKSEIAKNEQLLGKLGGLIKAKQSKLSSDGFVSRAPANVVQAERDSLTQLEQQLASIENTLVSLRAAASK